MINETKYIHRHRRIEETGSITKLTFKISKSINKYTCVDYCSSGFLSSYERFIHFLDRSRFNIRFQFSRKFSGFLSSYLNIAVDI